MGEDDPRDDLEHQVHSLERQGERDRATIQGLEDQAEADRQTISELGDAADVDRQTITDLRDQEKVDQELIAHLEAEGVIDRAKIANLEIALITARRIGAAIGVLMASEKVTDAQAFDLLRRASQNGQRKLRDIADDVLLTGTLRRR